MMEYMNEPGRGSKVMEAAAREAFDQETLVARHGRMPKTAGYIPKAEQEEALRVGRSHITVKGGAWPPANAWLGTSVENQKTFVDRMQYLIATKAAVRWLSIEPLLGPIDASVVIQPSGWVATAYALANTHWVVVGGESGPGARPMDPEWARTLRDQCTTRGIPFFFKQYGDWAVGGKVEKDDSYAGGYAYNSLFGGRVSTQCVRDRGRHTRALEGNRVIEKVGKHKAGRLLDGREWNQYPR